MTVTTSPQPPLAERLRSRLGWLGDAPLYVKLAVAFFLLAVFTVASVVVLANRSTAENLIIQLGENLHTQTHESAATVTNMLVDRVVSQMETMAMNTTLQVQIAAQNARYGGTDSEILSQINELDQAWLQATDSAPQIRAILSNSSAYSFNQFSTRFPSNVEVFATDRYGALVASNIRTSDYKQSDEAWWQAIWNNGQGATYLGQPEWDESSQTYSVIVGVPVYSANNARQVIGVLRSTYRLDSIMDTVVDFELGATGRAELYLNEHEFISETSQMEAAPVDAETQAILKQVQAVSYLETVYRGVPRLVSMANIANFSDRDYIRNLGWWIVVYQDTAEALEPIAVSTNATITAGIIVIAIAVAAALGIAQLIVAPIRTLNRVVQRLGAGDLSQRATLKGRDEIGQMAQTVNSMAEQLQGMVNTLEDRITSRTRDLETAAQVNAQISTILDMNRLLQDVVDLTKERFRLYHAHVYLLDDDGQTLSLASGAGHVGRQMVAQGKQIDISSVQSIVAEAARTRQGVIINDVTASPTFLPNALLPDTQSELAVPLVARGQLLGVLDVQSNQVGYFNQDVLAVLELMAGQIATAISNARLYEVADRTSRHERALGNIDRKIQGAVDMDDILQTTVRELGKALRVPYTAIELQLAGGGQQESE